MECYESNKKKELIIDTCHNMVNLIDSMCLTREIPALQNAYCMSPFTQSSKARKTN